jgi:hypothetical protein
MARKRQRVFKGGAEYEITGAGGKYRRLKFLAEDKVEGKEILLFRPIKRVKKLRG